MPKNNQEPYVLNPQTGRKYYGKALGSRSNQEELWTDRPYQSGYNVSHPYSGRVGVLAGAAAAYGLARKSPAGWDTATHLSRIAEDYSPFNWGRTFQISNILSHREKSASCQHDLRHSDQAYCSASRPKRELRREVEVVG